MAEAPLEVSQGPEVEISPDGEVVLNAIKERRSYREFSDEPVDPRLITRIIETVLHAPSSKNAQPWKLHVVPNKALLNEIADMFDDPEVLNSRPIDPKTGLPNENFAATVKESADAMRSGASVAFFIEDTSPFMGGRDNVIASEHIRAAMKGHEFEMIGIGALAQSMYMAVEACGLGGVFMGDITVRDKAIQERLGMQGDAIAVFVFGYPTKSKTQLWEKPPIDEAAHVVYHD